MKLADWHRRYLQQSEWTTEVRRRLFKSAGLNSADRVLEVGCGTGAVMSRLTGEQSFSLFGVDIDRSSLVFAANKDETFRLAGANGHRLPFPDATFNAVYCHYLLLWINDPGQVMAEMRRVTRPGGTVMALSEPDHAGRIDAPPPLDQLGELQTQALAAQGADVTLGRKLRGLFHDAGLLNVASGLMGAEWGKEIRPDPTEWQVLQNDLKGLIHPVMMGSYKAADHQAREEGERVLFIPTFYAIGWVSD
ncbi:methyltransferase domain-containing protein [bacterium]|nr:methyltransferase domain-containing protein [bacterium]